MSIIKEIKQSACSSYSRFCEIKPVLAAFDGLLAGRYVVYLSTPMTTGMEYYKNGCDSVLAFEKNYENAQKFEKWLENQYGYENKFIINPTDFYDGFSCWTYNECLYFWMKFIEGHVNEIIFNKNWEWSNGCCFEYLVGRRNQNIVMKELTYDNYLSDNLETYRLRGVVEALDAGGYDSSFIRKVLEDLDGYLNTDITKK